MVSLSNHEHKYEFTLRQAQGKRFLINPAFFFVLVPTFLRGS